MRGVLVRVAVRGVRVVHMTIAGAVVFARDGERREAICVGRATPFLGGRHIVVVRLGLTCRLDVCCSGKAKWQRRGGETARTRLALSHAESHVMGRRDGETRGERAGPNAGHVELVALSGLGQTGRDPSLKVGHHLGRRVSVESRMG